MYRLIREGQFAAIRIRSRLVVPAETVEAMGGRHPVEHPLLGPDCLDVDQVARALTVSRTTLYRLIHDGGFPSVVLRGRVVIPGDSVDAMIATAIDRRCTVDPRDWVALFGSGYRRDGG
jgi:excisionase family DNA binding protein